MINNTDSMRDDLKVVEKIQSDAFTVQYKHTTAWYFVFIKHNFYQRLFQALARHRLLLACLEFNLEIMPFNKGHSCICRLIQRGSGYSVAIPLTAEDVACSERLDATLASFAEKLAEKPEAKLRLDLLTAKKEPDLLPDLPEEDTDGE
jgi:hypothetical protein